jgi:hypothetical protein
MKKEYMIPAMRVVKIQQRHIICTSTGGYDSQPVQMRSGSSENRITDEEQVW